MKNNIKRKEELDKLIGMLIALLVLLGIVLVMCAVNFILTVFTSLPEWANTIISFVSPFAMIFVFEKVEDYLIDKRLEKMQKETEERIHKRG